MSLEYPRSDIVLGLKGQRLRLGLWLTAIRHGFELYECLLVFTEFRTLASLFYVHFYMQSILYLFAVCVNFN